MSGWAYVYRMPPLTITGYVREISDEGEVTIDGCGWAIWSKLSPDHWWAGVRRRVNKDRTSCVVKMYARAECFKDGRCALADLVGCYVEIRAKTRKYLFRADGAEIKGWTIQGEQIKKIDIPAGHTYTRAIDDF